jgi:hypothetical protein
MNLAKKPKAKEEPQEVKKIGRTYPKHIIKQCVDLAREGKCVDDIVKIVNGPRKKAVERYCRKAEVVVKK